MMTSGHRLVALAAGILLTLTACGGDDKAKSASGDDSVPRVSDSATTSSSTTPSETADPDLPSNDDLHAYFDALSTDNIDALEKASELAEKGSVAEAYLGYTLAGANANIDGGTHSEGNPIEETETGYKSCGDPADDSTCIEWADVEGRAGKIVSFTANGEPVRDRIVAGNGKQLQAGSLATLTFLYAYKSVLTPNLYVVVGAESGDSPVTVALYDATFRTSTGRQLKSDNEYSSGPTDLGANSSATMVMAFPQGELGGSATVSVFSEDFMDEEPVSVPTK